ncbi:MAG: hypothetical protein JJD92_01290 [Frankiaceae bacterium]|nr:hypothetical protein [Frankiaceae bacterium]
MAVDTRPRLGVTSQPTSRRGIIRAGELVLPTFDPAVLTRGRELLAAAGRGTGRASLRGGRRFGAGAWQRRVGLSIFLPAFAVYVTIGALLAFKYNSFHGDAQSRLANAFYVLFSRDPHMGAIGFVWNPLPSLSVMPLLLLKGIWPALVDRAFAANIMSAAFMAGSVVLVHAILRDLLVRRTARLVLTVLFAVQPMILIYGGNGMSEAIFLFFLLLATLRLSGWLGTGATWDLVLAGVALGFAYLARNEAVMPSILAAGVVLGVTVLHTPGAFKARLRAGALNAFILAAPAAFAFLMWAAISWIIVGSPFEQFTSQYGNASQIAVGQQAFENIRGGIDSKAYVGLQLAALAPLLPLAAAGAVGTAWRRRDLRLLAPLSVIGGVVLFAVLAFLAGQTVGWLRYSVTAVPLSFLLAGCALAGGDRPARLPWVRGAVAAGLAVVIGLPSIGTSVAVMTDSRLAHEEHELVASVFDGHVEPGEYEFRGRHAAGSAVSAYIDAMHLPRGALVMDTFTPCVPLVVLTSEHPKQFVITNDRDFQPVLADPVTFKAEYVLVPPRGGLGDLDEINRTYPTLYESGAGFADLEHEFKAAGGCPAYRLYKLRPGSTQVHPG